MLAILLMAGLFLSPVLDGADEQYAFLAGLAEKGMHERVVKEAESFLAQYPRHAKADSARYRLACALFEMHESERATSEFKKLSSHRGFEFEAEVAFRLGQCQLERGDCGAAESAFQRAIDLHKDYLAAPAHWLQGEARLRCGHYDTAEASYEEVLSIEPEGKYAADATAGLAWCAFKARKFDAAAERARHYLDRYARGERKDEIRLLLGEAELELKQPKEALESYRAVGDGPWSDGALRGAGFAYAALGDHERAAQSFASVAKEMPDSRHAAECALQGGIEWIAAKRYDEALSLLRSKVAGESVDVLTWRARAEAAAGDGKAALKSLDRAIAIAPDDAARARLRSTRADVLAASGRSDEALREYERAGSDYALQAAAVAALQAGKSADAMRSARKLLDQFPESVYRNDAAMVIGEALLATKDFEHAKQAFESASAKETDPAKLTRARSRIAWCEYLGGDKNAASALFAAIAADNPRAPEADEAQFMAARAREASGDGDAAQLYSDYLARFRKGARRDEAQFRRAQLDRTGVASLEALLRENPRSEYAARARFEIAERCSAAAKYPEAIARYREILDVDADSDLAPAARYGLAWCLQQSGDSPGAVAILRPWMDAKGLDAKSGAKDGSSDLCTSALELLVWSEARISPPDGVLSAWRALAASTNDEERLLRTARAAVDALRKADRANDAASLVDAFAKRARDPKVVAALSVERVYLCLDQKRVDGAERELSRAASALGDDAGVAEAAYFVGEAHFTNGDAKRALGFYDQAAKIARNPARDRALYKAGFARLKADDAAGAERCFAELVATCPKSALYYESLFLLGEAQYRQKKLDEAIASFQRVRAEAPDHEVMPKVLFRLGVARADSEDWKGALEALSALAAAKPDFENMAEAELARGRALAHLDRARDARGAFERTIALDKGALSARAHIELGRLHLASKDLDAALSEFLKVEVLYDLPEENAEALMLSGKTLEAQGDSQRAVEQYRELVGKHPSSARAPEAKKRIADIESKAVRRA
jgi:TolA-binding protein